MSELSKEKLEGFSIDIEDMCGPDFDKSKIKIVCVAPGLAHSVKEMGKAIRDQVVMVRIDEDSSRALDAWVEAGAVKSRSEAAALFIREGLKVRGSERQDLRELTQQEWNRTWHPRGPVQQGDYPTAGVLRRSGTPGTQSASRRARVPIRSNNGVSACRSLSCGDLG